MAESIQIIGNEIHFHGQKIGTLEVSAGSLRDSFIDILHNRTHPEPISHFTFGRRILTLAQKSTVDGKISMFKLTEIIREQIGK